MQQINTIYGLETPSTPTKICSICSEEKSVYDFGLRIGAEHSYRDTDGKHEGQRRNECKQCKGAKDKQVRLLKKQYPVPDNHSCDMCGKDESTIRGLHNAFKKKSIFVVDHNHKTGKFRGHICQFCNMLLGDAQDDKNILLQGYRYLNESENT